MRRKLHRHDLSCEKDFSGNMGYLIPTHFRMCYPGDVVRERTNYFVRVSPLLVPIISKVMIKAESFFVATDNVWTGAQEFYSRGQSGTSTKVIPTRTVTLDDNLEPGDLLNYLGFKPATTLNNTFNALPHRVYNAIYNWHYRDQDLQTARTIDLGDTDTTSTISTVARRCWERDRFTTARLEPQRGDDVLIPMNADSNLDMGLQPVITDSSQPLLKSITGTAGVKDLEWATAIGLTAGTVSGSFDNGASVAFGTNSGLDADLSDVDVDLSTIGGTIRELEEAVAINRFRKRLQTADGSYPDYTLATFGIRAPDIELQKPVLLARSSSPLQISEVVQTSPDMDAGDSEAFGVGNLAGHGIATATGHGYKYHVKRHGYIMTIFSVVPKSMYVQGNDKEWYRSTPDDYFDPDLDQIGEEAIIGAEVSRNQTTAGNLTATFGYQYRNYCDRSSLNSTAGEMDTTLNMWHQARDFGTDDVALNSDFVTCTPTDRIFALGSTQDQLRVKAMHDIKMLRVMRRIPMKGVL